VEGTAERDYTAGTKPEDGITAMLVSAIWNIDLNRGSVARSALGVSVTSSQQPLLRHDWFLSKLFSHNAWLKKARSGRDRGSVENVPGMFSNVTPIMLGFLIACFPSPPLSTNRIGKGEGRGEHHCCYFLDLLIISHERAS
jgi:hypothetical protein